MKEQKPGNISHDVDNLVITCADHRFQEVMARYLQEKHAVDINQSDRLSYNGSSKAVADGTLIPPIKVLSRLHQFNTIWLIDHTDCGGFGGLEAYGHDEQKELNDHFDSIGQAKEIIRQVLPQVVVTSFVVGLDGEYIGLNR